MFDFSLFKGPADKLAQELQSIRDQIEQAKRRREDLQTLPVSREALYAAGCDWIDTHSKIYLEGLSRSLQHVITSPLDDISQREQLGLLNVDSHGQTDRVMQAPLLFLLAPEIKAGLKRAIEAMPYAEVTGPDRAERLAEIEKLDRKIERLEEQETTLVTQADAAYSALAQSRQPRRKGE